MSETRKVLICGVSGQDGSYLAQLLLSKGYEVYGTSRDAQTSAFTNLVRLGIREKIRLVSMVLTDFRSVLQTLVNVQPDEIYNLAGQSSVGLSFQQPVETLESISVGTLNLLESIRFIGKPIHFYNASSSECFGDTYGVPATEETSFRPRSPYAVAKAAAHWQVANYREAYGLYACSGILFNHESPLRPEHFVTQKIIRAICRIASGSNERLSLGNLDIRRDWGWAPEYVHAMWVMLKQNTPEDFVVATGEMSSLQDFVAEAFATMDIDWRDYVDSDPSFIRPTDLSTSCADPSRAAARLGWEAQTHVKDVVRKMVMAEQERIENKVKD